MKNTIDKQRVEECGFAESMVSYMYDEIGAAGSQAFEAHLLDCTRCTDEFAELSTARLAMFEWNRDEFAHIATPHFVNPAVAASAPGRIAVFVEGLRGLLTPLSTAAAAVVLLFVTGVAFYLNSDNGSTNIAANTQKQEEIPAVATRENIENEKPAEPRTDSAAVTPIETKTVPAAAPTRAESPRKQVRVPQRTERAVSVQRTTPKSAATVGKTPVLSSFKETDDKSLRLADLFDDIGG